MNQQPAFELSVPVQSTDHVIGASHAPVTIVEYGDFECPNCKQAASAVKLLLERFAGRTRAVFRHFPLEEVHPHALAAAQAAECAGAQGKFWEMHDLLFAGQDKLSREDLIAKAKQLNLDVPRFPKDLDSHRFKPLVDADRREGSRLGVDATPFFFINGHAISGGVVWPSSRN
jgi:protein-disulfide isomerase